MTIYTPYPIYGTCYDAEDGTTAKTGVRCTLYNVTTGAWLPKAAEYTTAANGQYTIDPANLTAGYTDGDNLQVAFIMDNQFLYVRHTIVTATGYYEKNAVLHYGDAVLTTGKCVSFYGTNSTAGGLYIDIYNRAETFKARLEIPAGDTRHLIQAVDYSKGIEFTDGWCMVLESETAGELFVTYKVI